MNFIKTENSELINNLRLQLYQKLTAPVDVMWEQLYIGSSQSYLIEAENKNMGYCCIDSSDSLLQIFLLEEYLNQMNNVIVSLIESKLMSSAKLSSNEPVAFNTCLYHSKAIKSNTLCFQHSNIPLNDVAPLNLQLALQEDIPAVKVFLKEQVGMDDTFGYTENLVARKEIFLIKEQDVIMATSERRMSDTQPKFADLGIIVNRDFQNRGIATQVMQMQVNSVLAANRQPICSTTIDNIASRKTIEKSGFYCSNILFDISFGAH